MMKGLLLVMLVPLMSFSQVAPTETWVKGMQKWVKSTNEWLDSQPIPTGKFRTVEQQFVTIYSPKAYNGYCMQREMNNGGILYWDNVSYYRLTGLFKKKKEYKLWEIYNPTLTK